MTDAALSSSAKAGRTSDEDEAFVLGKGEWCPIDA
jgi:hypothetical protein